MGPVETGSERKAGRDIVGRHAQGWPRAVAGARGSTQPASRPGPIRRPSPELDRLHWRLPCEVISPQSESHNADREAPGLAVEIPSHHARPRQPARLRIYSGRAACQTKFSPPPQEFFREASSRPDSALCRRSATGVRGLITRTAPKPASPHRFPQSLSLPRPPRRRSTVQTNASRPD
jgi:hypothetical protein